jgi:predicted nucleic acid-binding protein
VAGRVLIDTNVLVYDTGVGGEAKAMRAGEVLQRLRVGEAGSLSTQVLCEYASTMIRRMPAESDADIAASILELLDAWPVALVTGDTVVEALRCVADHRMSYYDAQIWATARLNGMSVVLSEDFTDGREIEGVRFIDPFLPGFDLACLI